MVWCQGLPIQNRPGGRSPDSLSTACLPCPAFHPILGWNEVLSHALCSTCCVWGGPTHTGTFVSPTGFSPLNKIPFCLKGALLFSSACRCRCIENRVEKVGMCTRLHSWGRLRAPPGTSLDTPTQKHPGNGLSSAPPILRASSTAAASGVPGKPLRCPLLVPNGLKGTGP